MSFLQMIFFFDAICTWLSSILTIDKSFIGGTSRKKLIAIEDKLINQERERMEKIVTEVILDRYR